MKDRKDDTEKTKQVPIDNAHGKGDETPPPAGQDPRQVAAVEAFLAKQRRAMGQT